MLDVLDDNVVGTLYACSDIIEELGRPPQLDDRGVVVKKAGLAQRIA